MGTIEERQRRGGGSEKEIKLGRVCRRHLEGLDVCAVCILWCQSLSGRFQYNSPIINSLEAVTTTLGSLATP